MSYLNSSVQRTGTIVHQVSQLDISKAERWCGSNYSLESGVYGPDCRLTVDTESLKVYVILVNSFI